MFKQLRNKYKNWRVVGKFSVDKGTLLSKAYTKITDKDFKGRFELIIEKDGTANISKRDDYIPGDITVTDKRHLHAPYKPKSYDPPGFLLRVNGKPWESKGTVIPPRQRTEVVKGIYEWPII